MFVKSCPAVCANSVGAASGTEAGVGGTVTAGGTNADDTVTLSSAPGSQIRYTVPGAIPVASGTLSDGAPADAGAESTVETQPATYVVCVYSGDPAPGVPNCSDPDHGPTAPSVITRLRPSSIHADGLVITVSAVGVYP